MSHASKRNNSHHPRSSRLKKATCPVTSKNRAENQSSLAVLSRESFGASSGAVFVLRVDRSAPDNDGSFAPSTAGRITSGGSSGGHSHKITTTPLHTAASVLQIAVNILRCNLCIDYCSLPQMSATLSFKLGTRRVLQTRPGHKFRHLFADDLSDPLLVHHAASFSVGTGLGMSCGHGRPEGQWSVNHWRMRL